MRSVLVGVTGSVAAIKVPELVERLTSCKDQKVNSGVGTETLVVTESAVIVITLS